MPRRPISLDHIPPKDHEGIGLVANAWAHLGGAVERIVWRLARLNDNKGAAITTHMGIKSRLDAACTLVNLEFPNSPQAKRLMSLHGYILGEEMYGTRNEILHSRTLHIGIFGPQTIRPITKARRRLKKQAKPVIPTEYQEAADRFLATATEVREILSALLSMINQQDSAPPP
ncbi:MAG: hypothetical protein QGI13_02115 [Rhodospirillales bacterium]|jgi:hypothetical protein|nr:hypothetical protein [Rhodospirillales bacterium]